MDSQYSPFMYVSRAIANRLQSFSWISELFELGARLKRERGAEHVFDFMLGNPEVAPPAQVLEAARQVLSDPTPGRHAYMSNAGFKEVRDVVAQRLARATGLPYTGSHVVMTSGAGGALNALFRAILDPGDEVITPIPCFIDYHFYVENYGGRLVTVGTRPGFLPDIEAIRAAVTPRTKAILVNSPNNPTGVVYGPEVFQALEQLLLSLDRPVLLISDEPYKAMTFDGRVAPEVPSLVTRAVVVTSCSKVLALPGERIGYLAVSPRLPEAAQLVQACTFTNRVLGFVNAPAIWQWAVAAVDVSVDMSRYQEKRDVLHAGLTRLGYRCARSEGTFYLFPESPLPDDRRFVRMLAQEGILAMAGSDFGAPGYFRLSLTVPRDSLERSLPAFERALQRAASGG